MIRFLLKGILRDRHRSLFPVIIISIGVMLSVVLHAWAGGILGDVLNFTARFSAGHLKVVTRAYAKDMDQLPLDLALDHVHLLQDSLSRKYPGMEWTPRIRFGGLLDAPDSNGETRAQGTAMGLAVDLLSSSSSEVKRLHIKEALRSGHFPSQPFEVLLSDVFAQKMQLQPGDTVTFIGSTMFGSMTMQNVIVAGTISFGITAMDRGSMLMDIEAAQQILDMNDACGELLGYFKTGTYRAERAKQIQTEFNTHFSNPEDPFSPYMLTLMDQNDLASMWNYISSMLGFMIFIFILAMSIVLWNAGLLNGLRRYGEVGLRLAIGEEKGHLYRSMIWESLLVGILGSLLGTFLGLIVAYVLQEKGIHIGNSIKNSSMMLPSVFRARIRPLTFFIGFIPGIFSTVLGTMLSGIGIYKRQTATLFKELEN